MHAIEIADGQRAGRSNARVAETSENLHAAIMAARSCAKSPGCDRRQSDRWASEPAAGAQRLLALSASRAALYDALGKAGAGVADSGQQNAFSHHRPPHCRPACCTIRNQVSALACVTNYGHAPSTLIARERAPWIVEREAA
jgi:hypothetical protein